MVAAVLRSRRQLPQPSPRPVQAGKPGRRHPRAAETDAEIGLAFDGDGDRLGVVTKDGEIIYPDRQLMLFAADVLRAFPAADHLRRQMHAPAGAVDPQHGGVPLMWKTGHALVKAKLKETGAPLAGEMSGHTFFKERWYGFDDGLYAGARLLEILSRAPTATPC
jgi:phosphomannomutase/phosphoglucomutase